LRIEDATQIKLLAIPNLYHSYKVSIIKHYFEIYST